MLVASASASCSAARPSTDDTSCSPAAHDSGNSLLQFNSKRSRASVPAQQDDETDVGEASAAKPSGHANKAMKEVQATNKPAAVAPANEGVTPTARMLGGGNFSPGIRMFLLEAVWAARHQLQSAYQTRNFISVTIFVLICMLGLFILCAIWIMQSESRRTTQHQERDRRRMENNRRASNYGSG